MSTPEVVDEMSPTANMYGCQPCPKCGDVYRFPRRVAGVVKIQCDGCGGQADCVRADGRGWMGDPPQEDDRQDAERAGR